MAFVSRTERIINIAPANPTSELGPGQYLSATNFSKHLRPSKAPFMVSSTREQLSGARSKTPGVGTYNVEANNKMILLQQNEKKKYLDFKPLITENSNILNEKDFLGKKIGFMSNVTRFNENKVKNPGPGSYIKEIEFKGMIDLKHQQELDERKNPNFKPLSGSNCRVLSIPNKYQGYGYDVVDDKLALLNDDPELDAKYNGIDVKVGPGRYEVEKPKNWHRKGTSWSKSKVERLDQNRLKEKEKLSIKTMRRSIDEDTTCRSTIENQFSKTSQGFFESKKKEEREKVYKHIKNKEIEISKRVQSTKQKSIEGINRMIYEVTKVLNFIYKNLV